MRQSRTAPYHAMTTRGPAIGRRTARGAAQATDGGAVMSAIAHICRIHPERHGEKTPLSQIERLMSLDWYPFVGKWLLIGYQSFSMPSRFVAGTQSSSGRTPRLNARSTFPKWQPSGPVSAHVFTFEKDCPTLFWRAATVRGRNAVKSSSTITHNRYSEKGR